MAHPLETVQISTPLSSEAHHVFARLMAGTAAAALALTAVIGIGETARYEVNRTLDNMHFDPAPIPNIINSYQGNDK